MTITGQCLCGAVQIEINGTFEYSGYCHCTRCRKIGGSAFSAFAAIRKEKLQIVKGAEEISIYERNADNISHFCRNCSSLLYAIVRDSSYAHVQMGVLIDDPDIRPQSHFFVADKAPWHEICDDLPQFAGLPSG